MTRLSALAVVVLITLGSAVPAFADEGMDALALFQEYVARSDRFDISVADLYADSAVIKAKRVGPGGQTQILSLTGGQWKALIRQGMALAKQRGDRDSFSSVSTKPSPTGVMVTADRQSHLKNYTSPWAILVSKDHDGVSRISAEFIETRP